MRSNELGQPTRTAADAQLREHRVPESAEREAPSRPPDYRTCREQRQGWCGSKWIRPEKRLAIYIRDGFSCAYCGSDLRGRGPEELNLDHLKPRSAGGSNSECNLVTACKSCNSSRGARSLRQFAPGGSLDRIRRLVRRKLNLTLAKAILAGEVGDPRLEALR